MKKMGDPLAEIPQLNAGENPAPRIQSDYFARLARFQTTKPKPILLTASPML